MLNTPSSVVQVFAEGDVKGAELSFSPTGLMSADSTYSGTTEPIMDLLLVGAANTLQEVHDWFEKRDLLNYFQFKNVWVEPDSRPLYETLDKSNSAQTSSAKEDVYTHLVSPKRFKITETYYAEQLAFYNGQFYSPRYESDYELQKPASSFALFSYNKQKTSIAGADGIIRLAANTFTKNPSEAFIKQLTINYSAGYNQTMTRHNLYSAMERALQVTFETLQANGVEATAENVGAYLDFACLLTPDQRCDELLRELTLIPYEGKTQYEDMFCYFIKQGWSPDFFFALNVTKMVPDSFGHLKALHDLWETMPLSWFIHHCYSSVALGQGK